MGVFTHCLLYFFGDPSIRRNVLGRGGWLNRVRVGLADYDRELYLAAYDDPGVLSVFRGVRYRFFTLRARLRSLLLIQRQAGFTSRFVLGF